MRDNEGKSPMHAAGKADSVDVIEYLISKRCDIKDIDRNGWTVFHHACYNGNLTLVRHLAEHYKHLLTMKDNNGQTVLHCAGYSGSIGLVQYLISKSLKVYVKDNNGRTILHKACFAGKVELVEYLFEKHKSLLQKNDHEGLSPLHVVAWSESNSVEVVKFLVRTGCNVADKDKKGRTILHYACLQANLALVKYLAEDHPDLLNTRDNDRKRPLYMARSSRSEELLTYLIKEKFK